MSVGVYNTSNFFGDYLIYLIIGGAVLLLIILVIIILCVKKSKHKITHIQIDHDYVVELINVLGKKSNISEIDVDGNKLKVLVKDLALVNLEALKEKASSGVFVTGNNIKTLFMYDSASLRNELKKYKEDNND